MFTFLMENLEMGHAVKKFELSTLSVLHAFCKMESNIPFAKKNQSQIAEDLWVGL